MSCTSFYFIFSSCSFHVILFLFCYSFTCLLLWSSLLLLSFGDALLPEGSWQGNFEEFRYCSYRQHTSAMRCVLYIRSMV